MMQSNPIELYLDVSDNASLLGTLLKEAFCSSKLALLVGSAISQFAPANIPLAADISSNLRALVIGRFSRYATRDDVKWGIDGLPFEILMSRLVEFAGLDIAEEFISKLITIRKPNPVHLQIGRLIDKCVAQGIDLTVVTTNYDLGIEYGSRSKLKPVVEENDTRKSNNGVCLFKPHGSLGIKGSLVLDAEREYRLAAWKHSFLRERLNGKTLVVLGYSGWDLDISLALNDCGLETVIWCCHRLADANVENWSPGRRQLMTGGKSRYSLILNSGKTKIRQGNVLKVLESVSHPEVHHIRLNHQTLQARLKSALLNLPRGMKDAWFAWVITRAGYGHIGMAVKQVIDRTSVISNARKIEYESTCYFYQGKHKTAALLERTAASIFRNDPHERTYHRANEAAYWNRGQYSIMAAIAIVRGLLELYFQGYKHAEFDSDVTYVRDQAMQIWPVQWMRGSSLGRMIARAIIRLGEKARSFDEQANLDRAAHVGTGGKSEELTKWRYIWFGQNARRINYQRIEARIAMDRFRQNRHLSDFTYALQLALESVMGSKCVGDPARLGKAYILLAELAFEGEKNRLPFPHDLLQRLDSNVGSWREFAHKSARKGWQEIQTSQTWFLSVWPGIWLYSLTSGFLGKILGKNICANLMSVGSKWIGA